MSNTHEVLGTLPSIKDLFISELLVNNNNHNNYYENVERVADVHSLQDPCEIVQLIPQPIGMKGISFNRYHAWVH